MTLIAPARRRRADHWFFSTSALLILAAILFGFAHSYFMAGIFLAPLPSLTIHIHAAVFSAWILLLVVQAGLVAAGKVRWHRSLGVAGFALAVAMIVMGTMAAIDSFKRNGGPPGLDRFLFLHSNLTTIAFEFPVLVYMAYRYRFKAAVHKRLILVANLSLVGAGIVRWPVPEIVQNGLIVSLVAYSLLTALVFYDVWSTGKVLPATIWAGAFLIFFDQTEPFLGNTKAWHALVSCILHVSTQLPAS